MGEKRENTLREMRAMLDSKREGLPVTPDDLIQALAVQRDVANNELAKLRAVVTVEQSERVRLEGVIEELLGYLEPDEDPVEEPAVDEPADLEALQAAGE